MALDLGTPVENMDRPMGVRDVAHPLMNEATARLHKSYAQLEDAIGALTARLEPVRRNEPRPQPPEHAKASAPMAPLTADIASMAERIGNLADHVNHLLAELDV